jgi:hypothetical protein
MLFRRRAERWFRYAADGYSTNVLAPGGWAVAVAHRNTFGMSRQKIMAVRLLDCE